ncbi:MAG: serine/threonine protein kinase [Candidatus Xenobiia bacterium LiM19]
MKIGSYELVKQLGEGGFGRTYLARHCILDEFACIKQNLEISPDDEALLISEARILWNLHHHSLPTLRDFMKVDDGSFVLAMSYIKGKDLCKVITEDYPEGIDVEHVCWIAQRLLNALHYLHFNGIVHSDIKPQNIIIQPEEHNAVLVDYGLSTVRPGRKSAILGYTEAFAAPEQIQGKPPLPETDMFGLGISMLFALGGNIKGKTYPSNVPSALQEYFNAFLLHDPMKRPKAALEQVKILSDLRERLFGRRSSGKDLKLS